MPRRSQPPCYVFLASPSGSFFWLMGENEAGQLALCLRPTHQQWECCLRQWRNHGDNRYGQTRSFVTSLSFSWHHHHSNFLESFRSLLRLGEPVGSSPCEPEWGFRQSFSTSATISAMKVSVQKCLRSATTGFYSFTCFIIAHNFILVEALSGGPSWQFPEYF